MSKKNRIEDDLHESDTGVMQAILREVKELRIGIWENRQGEKISYNLREAADLTGLAVDTLYKYYKSGKLRGTQPAGAGGAILILRQDLVDFLETGRDSVLKLKSKT